MKLMILRFVIVQRKLSLSLLKLLYLTFDASCEFTNRNHYVSILCESNYLEQFISLLAIQAQSIVSRCTCNSVVSLVDSYRKPRITS